MIFKDLLNPKGDRSTGRALALGCSGVAALLAFTGMCCTKETQAYGFKVVVAFLVAAWLFYSGGKGLEALEKKWLGGAA